MMKFKVYLAAEVVVEFDETSNEFKELFIGYTEAIDKDADYESLSGTIVDQISRYGANHFIEGIGLLKINGRNQNSFYNGMFQEVEAIINIETNTDINEKIEFEIVQIEKIL